MKIYEGGAFRSGLKDRNVKNYERRKIDGRKNMLTFTAENLGIVHKNMNLSV